MIVTCTQCHCRFNLNDDLVKPNGSKVRCSRCRSVFTVYPSRPTSGEPGVTPWISTSVTESDMLPQPEKTEAVAVEPETPEVRPGHVRDTENLFEDFEEMDVSDLEKPDLQAEPSHPEAAGGGDLDFGESFQHEEGKEKTSGEWEPEELDLSEIEKLVEESRSRESEREDIEIEDLELTLDLDDEDVEADSDEMVGLDLSELEANGQEKGTGGSPEEDFDLGDLELTLDLDDEAEKAESSDEAIGLDLSELEDVGDKGAGGKTPEIEDLGLLLDFDGEAAGVKPDDLSDIEKMVEESVARESAKGESHSLDDIELELDLDQEPEIKGDQKTVPDMDEFDRLDLSDIGILDLEPPAKEAEQAPQTESMDGLEKAGGIFEESSPATVSSRPTISPLTVGETESVPTGRKAAFSEKAPMAAGQAAIGAEDAFRLDDFGDDAVLEKEEAWAGTEVPDSKKKAAHRQSKRISAPVMALLILTLLACAGYGGFILVDQMGIEIPIVSRYLNQYFGPKVEDPGNLRIEAFDITSQFVDNQAAGKLFVITGRLKNGYSEPRGFLSITAKLYTKGKVVARAETAFGGNVLSDTELANLDLEALKKRLSSRVGDNRSNERVPPNGVIPFMVVFSSLPENLEEFSLEVAGSMPVTQS